MAESRPEGLDELGYVDIPDIDTKVSSINNENNMVNPEIVKLPSNIAVSEIYSGIFGIKKKTPAQKAQKKADKVAKKEEKKAVKKANRTARKTTKADRKADRKQRKADRKAKRLRGEPLTADELADEELDAQEAMEDGDVAEAEEVKAEAKKTEETDYEEDDEDDKKGIPTWAKYTIGISAGVGIIGLATWGILSWINKSK